MPPKKKSSKQKPVAASPPPVHEEMMDVDPTPSSAPPAEKHPVDLEADLKLSLFNLILDDDIPYEEDCLRNPYALRCWVQYLEFKRDASDEAKFFIYERAVKQLPGSYKLWKEYLDLRVSRLLTGEQNESTGLRSYKENIDSPADPKSEWSIVNNCFERSLVLCNKYPVIWLMYCNFLMHQPFATQTRRTFDRALRSLPLTQHTRIWDLYLKFASSVGGETAIRLWRRYLKFEPENAEKYVSVLLSLEEPQYAEAARVLASIVENPNYKSPNGKSHFQLWSDLCDLVCEHADEIDLETNTDTLLSGSEKLGKVEKLDVDGLLRAGIATFTDQVGKLWNSLAMWWILKGESEKARDVYEEAISKVMTVRDFAMVFDSYSEFEETLLQHRIKTLTEKEANVGADNDDDDELDDIEIDLLMARFEKLMERRPFLVNDVLLRQNPHNVGEWQKRVELYLERGQFEKAVDTFTKAFATIAPKKAVGKLESLWVKYATIYEENGEIASARNIFRKASKVWFKTVDQLAEIWCQWADMELRNDNMEDCRNVMKEATAPPRGVKVSKIVYTDETISPQQRLVKSLKVWSKYVDIEEALGTIESTKSVYENIVELKIATPQIFINYATFLEENDFFEDSFKVYERGIDTFGYPIAIDFWNLYLSKFIQRYKGTKLERARDLFEHAVDNVPPKYARNLYLMYAKLEEEYGLTRRAMGIYDRATQAVDDADKLELFTIYIAKSSSYFGLPSSREIYEKAIEALPDRDASKMCIKYAELETKLGEIDRARGLYGYCSQFCDPRIDPKFWELWHKFEVNHGNKETFKEMLRIKRSVQAKFNTEVSLISAQLLAAKQNALPIEPILQPDGNSIAALEAQIAQEGEQSRMQGFVKATVTQIDYGGKEKKAVANPDEIEISMSDDEDDEEAEEKIERRTVPDAVFGGLANMVTDKDEVEENVGAKERFKRLK
ncbi:Pre-mRNA-splicing factor SYF1 [Nowakowskiella sp. JEL0407]|nr:Pre-mRNA-splicing factor SYF1 [Nowakowskiella sp. JEL0407]